MACKYTYQGKTYEAWEFVDVLAAMPAHELMKHLPEEARQSLAMSSEGTGKQTDSAAFKRWFADSKVVDALGAPKVVYHGSPDVRGIFSDGFKAKSRGNVFFAAEDYATADSYADDKRAWDYQNAEPHTIPLYLSIKNPMVIDAKGSFWKETAHHIDEAKAAGHDGIIIKNSVDFYNNQKGKGKPTTVYAWFEPEQAKSAVDGQLVSRVDRKPIDGAIGNNGKFDGSNPDIRASISFNPMDYRDRMERSDSLIANKIAGLMNNVTKADSAETFNWWHKTVGSQFHKAQIDRHFGRVFDRAQQFIEDVARYGTEAADLAPDLLPKMDTFFGALREVRNSKRDAEDQKALAAPIFDGTLFEDEDGNKGMVWSDKELSSIYNLNERQIGLYHQFRNAVDKSLESMAIAEMNKVARINELELPSGEMSMSALASFYSEQYADQLSDLRRRYDERAKTYEANEKLMKGNTDNLKMSRKQYHETMTGLQTEYAAEQGILNRQIEELEKMDKAFTEKAETIKKLQQEGYAPLMRFGKYTVDVVQMVPDIDESTGQQIMDTETGELGMKEERIFFSMFETENEAREAERVMNEEYPKAMVTRGVSSQDGWQLFGSINPGSLEMLAELVGKEDEVVQKFYKEATASRSALKRLIHRKGTAGYSKEVTRSLASFLMSNARATASADHFGDIMEAAADIPKEKGDVKDEAVRLISYIRNPNEEAGTLRGLLFMQYLGGSIASAMVNLTQTMTTTLPYLSQYGGNPAELVKSSMLAMKRMNGKSLGVDPELGKALEMAEDEGVVAPHNIHNLMGQSGVQGATGNKILRMASHIWGSFFGMAEQFNRETAFIAAFQLAQKMGPSGLRSAYRKQSELNASRGLPPADAKHFASPYSFAKNAVNETQFILSKAARPNWARGTVGATLFTFKQFSVMYLELLKRLPNKERAIMLGVLVLLAGVSGLPFSDDTDDLIDTLGQFMGYDTNSRKWKDELLVETFGKTGADFVSSGISAFLPLELSSRLGMGNLIPATGLFKKSNSGNHERDYAELMGAAGGYAKQLMDAWDYTLQGRYGMAAAQGFLPKGLKDLSKGLDMATTGTYDDTHGRMVTQVDGLDALVKAIGFQPSKVADIQRLKGYQMQDIALAKSVKASISEIWATGIHNKNPERTALAREMLQEWNQKNPNSQIKVDLAAVQRRVKQMNMTAAERMEKVAPKEMRAGVRAAFSEG